MHDKQFPVLDLLRNLFATLHFPQKVVNEYAAGALKEPSRQWLINKLRPESGFFRLCTNFDSIVQVTASRYKGMDPGESEAYAQLRKVHAHMIISDDKRFIKALNALDHTVQVYSSLHILCWLQLSGFIADWKTAISRMYRVRRFTSAELRKAYTDILFTLGISIPKQKISSMCSLSNWLS